MSERATTLLVFEADLLAPAKEVEAVASTMGHRKVVLSIAPAIIAAAEDSSAQFYS
jgi:hypothetical protein